MDNDGLNKSGNKRGIKNKGNLVVSMEQTPEERRKAASKAGKASGEARRVKRDQRDVAKLMLEMPVSDTQGRLKSSMKSLGCEEKDMDYWTAVVATMIVKAVGGDVRAATFLSKSAGYDPAQRLKEEEFEYMKQNGTNLNVSLNGELETKSRVQIYLPEIENKEE